MHACMHATHTYATQTHQMHSKCVNTCMRVWMYLTHTYTKEKSRTMSRGVVCKSTATAILVLIEGQIQVLFNGFPLVNWYYKPLKAVSRPSNTMRMAVINKKRKKRKKRMLAYAILQLFSCHVKPWANLLGGKKPKNNGWNDSWNDK
jgi:hypothetical protein